MMSSLSTSCSICMHEHWKSRFGFLMAAAGSAVGLGSLWRFPYIAGENGGGAFVLLYLLLTFGIGLPVFIAELIIGRRTQKSAVLAYSEMADNSPNWRGLGWLNLLTSLLILSYYSVVSGWCLSYTVMSLNKFTAGKSTPEIQAVFDLLSSSAGISILWFGLFLLINVVIVFGGIRKGIEHWAKILMPALFVLLIGLFIYATTMDGFGAAAKFAFYPDFSKLNSSGVLNALGMAFFTLSVGLGIIVTYGSYMQPHENIPTNALLIALMTIFVSLIAALTIFPIVFTFNLPPESGPSLVFKTLPVLFAQLPATLLLSTIFFALLLFAALTSTISLLEVLVANMIEIFSLKRSRATFIAAALAFVVGLPSALAPSKTLFPDWQMIYGKDFFDTVSYLTASWFMPIAGLLLTILAGWRIKKSDLIDEFLKGSNARWLVKPWYFMLRFVAPAVVIIILLQEAGILAIFAQK